jgi:hypothetical protein
MNNNQKQVLIGTACVLIWMLLNPPLHISSMGSLLKNPPKGNVDIGLQAFQMLVVFIVAGLLFAVSRTPSNKP